MFAEAADRKGLQLTLTTEADVPRWVVLDGRRLRQILLNLIGNAIKFTNSGHVRLTISRAPGGDRLGFDVSDTGIGIEPEALSEIFAAFAQSKSGAAAGGTGLGLAICDQLIKKMGGEFTVESVFGEGSRFSFDLPLVLGRQTIDSPGRNAEFDVPAFDARLGPGQKVTALVVDDSTANRHILAGLLESAGVAVVTAAGGLEAIELGRAHRPDVVFMDLKMNDLDGLEATRRLARDPLTTGIPVIAVTASAFGDSRQTAREAGCVDYLPKPVRAQLLFAMLQTHLGVRFVSQSDLTGGRSHQLTRSRGLEVAARLREAVALGDIGGVQALARQLMTGDTVETALGERINRLAMNFDFSGLGNLAGGLEG